MRQVSQWWAVRQPLSRWQDGLTRLSPGRSDRSSRSLMQTLTRLLRTAEALSLLYTSEVPPPDDIFILSNSAPALQAVKNPRSIMAQSHSLRFHKALTLLCLLHRNVSFFLVWAPDDDELEGQRQASTLATEACWRDPPNGLDRIQSASYQKDRARAQAFDNWARDFGAARCVNQWRTENMGLPPSDGHAHTHSITTTTVSKSPPPLVRCHGHGEGRHGEENQTPPLPPTSHIHGIPTCSRPRIHGLLRPAV